MALRDQPYLPLYIQDFLTDEKLMECSASATGVYIKIMCILHKSEEYGVLLLKQKDKQNEQQKNNFALMFAYKLLKFLPFTVEVIHDAIVELVSERVLHIDGDKLIQKRMQKDGLISDKRSKSGREGGNATQSKIAEVDLFAKANVKANVKAKGQANSENESEYVNEGLFNIKGVDFRFFWDGYQKKVGDQDKIRKKWNDLTEKTQNAILDYLPKYIASQPEKRFRKNPEVFLNQKAWLDEIIPASINNSSTPHETRIDKLLRVNAEAKQILRQQIENSDDDY